MGQAPCTLPRGHEEEKTQFTELPTSQPSYITIGRGYFGEMLLESYKVLGVLKKGPLKSSPLLHRLETEGI